MAWKMEYSFNIWRFFGPNWPYGLLKMMEQESRITLWITKPNYFRKLQEESWKRTRFSWTVHKLGLLAGHVMVLQKFIVLLLQKMRCMYRQLSGWIMPEESPPSSITLRPRRILYSSCKLLKPYIFQSVFSSLSDFCFCKHSIRSLYFILWLELW